MNLSEALGILYICLVIVMRFSALCPSVFTCTYSKIHTDAVFHCCQHLSFRLFSQAFDSLTFTSFFLCFLCVPVSAFLSNHPSVICILPFSFYTSLFLSLPFFFFPKSSNSWCSKHKARRKSKKQRNSSTVCNSILITTLT